MLQRLPNHTAVAEDCGSDGRVAPQFFCAPGTNDSQEHDGESPHVIEPCPACIVVHTAKHHHQLGVAQLVAYGRQIEWRNGL